MIRYLLAVVLIAAAPLALAQAPAGEDVPEAGIQVGAGAISDSEIEDRIRGVLDEIGGYDRVGITVSSGVVTLEGEVVDGTSEDDLTGIVERVEGVVAINNRLTQSTDLNERLAPAIDRLVERSETVLVNAPIFLVAVSAFILIATVGWFLTTRLRLWKRLAPNSFIAEIYRAVARIAFVVMGLVVALDILNATALLGAVLGAAGVVGLAVGFAVRDTVENFIASILLSLRQPFRPNDFVDIDGDQGSVARLTSRATILISPDGNHIRIPNATVFKGRIVNYSRDPNRRFTFDLGVDADADLAAALSTAVGAVESLPFVLRDPPVSAWIEKVGDSNVVLMFAGWVDQTATDFVKARGEAIRVSKTALEAAGFGLPEPIYRVRLDGAAMPVAQTDDRLAQTERRSKPVAHSADLPEAAAPEISEQATENAVVRERASDYAGADLLREGRGAE